MREPGTVLNRNETGPNGQKRKVRGTVKGGNWSAQGKKGSRVGNFKMGYEKRTVEFVDGGRGKCTRGRKAWF